MKIAILYYSETGNTEKMAGFVRDGVLKADRNIEVVLINLAKDEDVEASSINDCSAVIFGTPCYVANMCWQLHKFFDTRFDCKLEGKLAACFATANCMWGGADVAIMTVMQHAMTRGMLAYATGMEYGRPFIHLGPIALRDELDSKAELFMLFGDRVAKKALELFGDR